MGWMEDMKETDVRVCVGAVLILTRDCRRGGPPLVLLGKRDPKRPFYPGAWEVIGGHLEPGENAEQALVRELREEAGVITTEWHRLGEGPEPFPGGDGSIVLHLYAVTSWNGVPRNHAPEEHSEVSCFAVGCSSLGTISGRFTELVGVAQRLSVPGGARDGGDAVVRGETGDHTGQESRSEGTGPQVHSSCWTE
jgi:8-oxo-dGTP diphosphatase